jgi:hypothetical protein
LEGRLVPANVSRVIDVAGNLQLFVVHSDGSLTHYNKDGATVWFTGGVQWAQTYLDPSGQFGVNVLLGGHWLVYDAAGGHDRGSDPRLRTVSTAFDPAGRQVLDVLANGGWYQYDDTGPHYKGPFPLTGPQIFSYQARDYLASTVIDRTGARTSDYMESYSYTFEDFLGGPVQSVNQPPTWYEVGPSGQSNKTPTPPSAVAAVLPSFDATGALVYDFVSHDGHWFYIDAQGVSQSMGTI